MFTVNVWFGACDTAEVSEKFAELPAAANFAARYAQSEYPDVTVGVFDDEKRIDPVALVSRSPGGVMTVKGIRDVRDYLTGEAATDKEGSSEILEWLASAEEADAELRALT